MYDVFLSYKSERRPAVRHLAKVLELYGYSVWYDHKLVAGADFARQIGEVLNQSKVVMPLWCKLSVSSDWVLEEAHVAKEHGVILPVMIEQIRLPFGFTRLDTVDLTAWDASPRSHAIDRLIDEVSRMVNKPPAINYAGLREYEESWRNFGAPSLAQFALSEASRNEADAPRAQAARQNNSADTAAPKQESSTSTNPPFPSEDFAAQAGAMGDMFDALFKGNPPLNETKAANKGASLRYHLHISLEQAFHGDTQVIEFESVTHCLTCNGTGRVGSGSCSVCSGSGHVKKTKSLSIKIPAGIKDGDRIRLRGEGEPGRPTGQEAPVYGDLYVQINLKPHARFEVDEADLKLVEKIPEKTARKGGAHRFQDIKGDTIEMTVPKGASRGQILRLRGQGMTDLRKPDGERGDLYVELDF